MKISILSFDDFTDLDLILHWDILNRVKYIGGIRDWEVKIVGTQPVHTSTLGLPIPTSGTLDDLHDSDGVILCSGKGTRSLLNDQEYLGRLKLNTTTQAIGAQCSGSLILGALGLLRGVQVSAYPPVLNELRAYGADLIKRSLVVDGKIATASSCLAGQFLSRWIIDTLVGTEVGDRVMETVLPLGHSSRATHEAAVNL